jgi:hypothetical protein
MLLIEIIINWYFMHGYNGVGRGSNFHLPFAHGTFLRFASLIGSYIQWKKSRTMGCHVQYWTTFTLSCTFPLNYVKTLKLS